MKIIIPMSGSGKRFVDAQYKEIKPLIKVDGKSIIEYVVNLFPGENDFIFICNKEHLEKTELRKELQRIKPTGKIIAIEPHKKGPIHAIAQIEEHIKDDEPVIVSYCDYNILWDYNKFKKEMQELDCDGSIPSYIHFHPHHRHEKNVYGYSKVDSNNQVLAIQEKKPYTSNKMEEPAAIGMYYFKKGKYLKKYGQLLMEKNINVKGEYFVSLLYNLMNKDGLKSYVYEIPYFLQWGAPEDLEEYEAWSQFFAKKANKAKGETSKPEGRIAKQEISRNEKEFERTYKYWEQYFKLVGRL